MQTKQLIGCSAVALLFLTFTCGCVTGGAALPSLSGYGLFKQRDTFGSGPVNPAAQALAPAPKARRVNDPWTPRAKDEPEMPKLSDDGPFRKRKATDEPEDFMPDLPPVRLTPTDPRERARQMLAEEEALSKTGALDFPDIAEPTSVPDFDMDFQSLLYDVGAEVFASRAGSATGDVGDRLLEFRKNNTGTATTIGSSDNQTVDFSWQFSGDALAIGGALDGWRLPRNYVLHSFKKSLYLLPKAFAPDLKETLIEEGEIREEDLSADFVFDAVQPAFKLVPRKGGLRTAAASAEALPPPSALRGEDQKLRAAMEKVDVGAISWKKGGSINDSIFLLTSIWDENAPADAPALRLMADKRLAKMAESKPFASRVSMTFAQALQQLAESFNAKVVVSEGIVKLTPR